MNIIEAAKSGKRFKRKDWGGWVIPEDTRCIDALSDDWIVEETTVVITRSQFEAAWQDRFLNRLDDDREMMLKALGLE